MKKALSLILVLALLSLSLVSCGGNKIHHVEIVVENYGSVFLELDENVAPITVKNFIKLAKRGFYDRLTFTRMQSGFVLQGGQSSELCDSIKGEFASNGVENTLSHKKGVISMARSDSPDSATSQFFIMLDDNTALDGDYAAFGYVTEGMDIIEEICADLSSQSEAFRNDYYGIVMGFLNEEYQPVITTIKVID